eukprot:UN29254
MIFWGSVAIGWNYFLIRTTFDENDEHQREIRDIVCHPTVLAKLGVAKIHPQVFQGPMSSSVKKSKRCYGAISILFNAFQSSKSRDVARGRSGRLSDTTTMKLEIG